MAEAVAGTIPLETTGATAFEDDPLWYWSLSVEEGPVADLLQVQARVSRQSGAAQATSEFTLIRWIRDPELWTQSTVSGESDGGSP